MARLKDLLPSANFEDRTGIPRRPEWHMGGVGQDIPYEVLMAQRQWVSDAGRQMTEDENAALWEAYKEGRLKNFQRAYHDMGPPRYVMPPTFSELMARRR